MKVLIVQLCPALCNPMDCSPPGSSVHGIPQARILEWVAIPFSRVSQVYSKVIHLYIYMASILEHDLDCRNWWLRLRWWLQKLSCSPAMDMVGWFRVLGDGEHFSYSLHPYLEAKHCSAHHRLFLSSANPPEHLTIPRASDSVLPRSALLPRDWLLDSSCLGSSISCIMMCCMHSMLYFLGLGFSILS